MSDQHCGGDLNYLSLQIIVICMLLALIGTTVIVKHPGWFDRASVPQSLAKR